MRFMHVGNIQSSRAWLRAILVAAIVMMAPLNGFAAAPITDTNITIHVEEQFLADQSIPFDMIDTVTRDGIVTLTGTVYTVRAKEKATRIAETVRGVRSVINRIQVNPVKERPAETLREAVIEALLFDPVTESYEVDVSANDEGAVSLDGTVNSWQEREIAENVAKGVAGVTEINNRIDVAYTAVRDDSEIKPEIEKRMQWDTLLDAEQIMVRVDSGKVALTGIVGSAAERRRAVDNAWVSGVKSVDSSGLTVEERAREQALRDPEFPDLTNDEVRKAVLDAFKYDPRVSAFDVEVISNSGLVTLRGVVDNVQAKNAAGRDARNTVGVITVRNLIKVRPLANVDDEEIANSVEAALLRNSVTESYEIDVAVDNRMVRLEGVVDTHLEKVEAENVAYRAKGVVGVRNNIEVTDPKMIIDDPYIYDWATSDYSWYTYVTTTHKTDEQIANDIRDEFLWSPFVDGSDIDVTVESGTATLTGTVDSWMERRAAAENALEGGAITVENKLLVN